MKALGRAHTSLWWAWMLILTAGLLVERAQRDIDEARTFVRDERGRRIAAEDAAERAKADLDGALEALHEAHGEGPPPPPA